MELKQNISQQIIVGPFMKRRTSLSNNTLPKENLQISSLYWHYLVQPDNTRIDITEFLWSGVPNCAGFYFITIPSECLNQIGDYIIYLHDASLLESPVVQRFSVPEEFLPKIG